MAKNFFNRYVWLIETIRRAGHISLDGISDKWERSVLNDTGDGLPERTFHNHRKAVLDIFGIEIKNDRTLGYYIADESDIEGDSLKQWMFDSLSMNSLLTESAGMRNRILFEKVPSSRTYLADIAQAMKDEKAIEITYQSFHRQEPNTFVTHPYCLKLFKQRWYMLAKSGQYDHPRIYALDRLSALSITDTPLQVDKKFDAEVFFSNYFSIIIGDGGQPEQVDIRISADQVKYIESLPLHPSQKVIESTDEYTVFRYHIVPTYDFKQEILSRGCAAEVLSPQWFKDEIAWEVKEMAKRYGFIKEEE